MASCLERFHWLLSKTRRERNTAGSCGMLLMGKDWESGRRWSGRSLMLQTGRRHCAAFFIHTHCYLGYLRVECSENENCQWRLATRLIFYLLLSARHSWRLLKGASTQTFSTLLLQLSPIFRGMGAGKGFSVYFPCSRTPHSLFLFLKPFRCTMMS